MQLIHKDLLGIQQLTVDEINLIQDTAETMNMVLQANSKRTAHLQCKSIVTLFMKTAPERDCPLKWPVNSERRVGALQHQQQRQQGESLVDLLDHRYDGDGYFDHAARRIRRASPDRAPRQSLCDQCRRRYERASHAGVA